MTKLLRVAGLLALLAVAGAVLMAPSSAATQGQPFKASVLGATTDMTFAPDFPFVGSTFGGRCSVPSDWLISFAGTGNATHLGAFTWRSSHCTQLGVNPPATVTISDGRFEYVAANGDILRENYGDAVVSFPDSATMCMETHATFTGGTGRFTAASGSALERLCFPATSGPWLDEMLINSAGTIAYDPSDRAG
jgi:hypothetical protein